MTEWFYDAWIPGKPETQGSMRHVGKGRMIHKPALVEWRKLIQAHVEQFTGTFFGAWEPVTGPVALDAVFYLPKAASNRDEHPTGARSGDCDKYTRAVGDAISLGEHRLVADDSQIVTIKAHKQWAHGLPGEDGHEPGVRLRVRRV